MNTTKRISIALSHSVLLQQFWISINFLTEINSENGKDLDRIYLRKSFSVEAKKDLLARERSVKKEQNAVHKGLHARAKKEKWGEEGNGLKKVEGARKFKGVDWKMSKVVVKISVTLKIWVLIN